MKFVIAFLVFLMTVMVCAGVILMVNEPAQHASDGLKLVVYAFALAVGLGGSLLSLGICGMGEP